MRGDNVSFDNHIQYEHKLTSGLGVDLSEGGHGVDYIEIIVTDARKSRCLAGGEGNHLSILRLGDLRYSENLLGLATHRCKEYDVAGTEVPRLSICDMCIVISCGVF